MRLKYVNEWSNFEVAYYNRSPGLNFLKPLHRSLGTVLLRETANNQPIPKIISEKIFNPFIILF